MKHRGRKSAAELAVIPNVTPIEPARARPAPPAHLPASAAAVWRELVASRPAGFFDTGTHALLSTLAVATAEHRRLSAILAELDPLADLDAFGKITRACDTHALRIGAAATKLRLTVQATVDARTAGKAAADTRTAADRIRDAYGASA